MNSPVSLRAATASTVLTIALAAPLASAGDWSLGLLGAPDRAPATGLHFGFDPLSFTSGSGGGSVPVVSAKYMHRFEADFDSLPGNISSQEASLFLPILPLSYDRLRIVAALSYRLNWFDSSVPNLIPDDTLHALRLPVIAVLDLSDKWLLGAVAMPGISGDFSETSDGFSILAGLAAGYNVSDTFTVFGGGLYSGGFDESKFFPGVGFSWKPAPNWSVSLLPPFASISRKIGEDYFLSLFGRYDGPTWNVEADTAGPARDINIKEIRVGLRLERRIANRFWAYLGAGATLARRLEIETLNSSSLQESDIDPGAFVQGGINVRF